MPEVAICAAVCTQVAGTNRFSQWTPHRQYTRKTSRSHATAGARLTMFCMPWIHLVGFYVLAAGATKLVCCRAPAPRSKPVSRHQRALRRQENQIQQSWHLQQRSHKHKHVTCEAATAELATEKATVKIGTRGSPLALAQAYMTRDFLKVEFLRRLCSH